MFPSMRKAAAIAAVLSSLLLAVAFARALPAVVDREREGRMSELQAVCDPALRPEADAPALGRLPTQAPPFTLKDWNGREVSLASTQGRVTLVNFWATWCQTCVVEMPSLEKLAAAEKGRPFSLLAVSVDDKWEDVWKFFAGRSTQMTVLLDKEHAVPSRYGTSKFPETFILDKQGRVRFYVISDRDWSSSGARACIEALINE